MSRAEIWLPEGSYLSVGALAIDLRMSEQWVLNRIADGRIPAYKFGRVHLLPVDELPAFLVDAHACEMCEDPLRPARGWFVLQGAGEPDWTLCSACLAAHFESKGTVPI